MPVDKLKILSADKFVNQINQKKNVLIKYHFNVMINIPRSV
jgi:hypothetical protein